MNLKVSLLTHHNHYLPHMSLSMAQVWLIVVEWASSTGFEMGFDDIDRWQAVVRQRGTEKSTRHKKKCRYGRTNSFLLRLPMGDTAKMSRVIF